MTQMVPKLHTITLKKISVNYIDVVAYLVEAGMKKWTTGRGINILRTDDCVCYFQRILNIDKGAKMAHGYFAFILAVSLNVASSMPPTKLFRSRKWYSANDPCVKASSALEELVAIGTDLASVYVPEDISWTDVSNLVVNFDVYDERLREDALCRLQDLETLSELKSTLDILGLDFHFVKILYMYVSETLPLRRQSVEMDLQRPEPYLDESYLTLVQHLYEQIEASGFLDFDEDDARIFSSVFSMAFQFHFNWYDANDTVPLSPLPLVDQCSTITNSLRKVWNAAIKYLEQNNPEVGTQLRETVRNWTGIEFNSHEEVRTMICDIMDSAENRGVPGIYAWVVNHGVLLHVLKAGYPYLVHAAEELDVSIAYMTDDTDPTAYYDSPPYHTPFDHGHRKRSPIPKKDHTGASDAADNIVQRSSDGYDADSIYDMYYQYLYNDNSENDIRAIMGPNMYGKYYIVSLEKYLNFMKSVGAMFEHLYDMGVFSLEDDLQLN